MVIAITGLRFDMAYFLSAPYGENLIPIEQSEHITSGRLSYSRRLRFQDYFARNS